MTTEATPTAPDAHESHDKLYYKILAWLTCWTLLELGWADWFVSSPNVLMIGLGCMAAIKASMVGLYYMHLKWETKPLWFVIAFPLVLCIILVMGLLPDAAGYWR